MTIELALGLWSAVTILAIVSAVYLAVVLAPRGFSRLFRAGSHRGVTARR